MRRESGIEGAGDALLSSRGWLVTKVGRDGLPDRLVHADGVHVWLEWKSPTGRLTPAQRVVFRRLRAAGERVVVASDPVSGAAEVLSQLEEVQRGRASGAVGVVRPSAAADGADL